MKDNSTKFIVFFLLILGCKDPAEPQQIHFEGNPIPGTEVFFSLGFYGEDVLMPKISPDGTQLAFKSASFISGEKGLWVLDLQTGQRRLIHSNGFLSDWSPDGKWIAFNADAQIYKIKPNGDSLTQLTFDGRNFFPDWSPDGHNIFFDSDRDSPTGLKFIWKMTDDGKLKERIVYEPDVGEIREPSYAIQDFIVHIRFINGISTPEIFSMDSLGLDLKRLTHNDLYDRGPQTSPDGKQIVFYNAKGIWVMNSDGRNVKCIIPNHLYNSSYKGKIKIHARSPSWLPDGKHIIYEHFRITKSLRRENGYEVEGYISFYIVNVEKALEISNL